MASVDRGSITKTILFASEMETPEIVEAIELGVCGVILNSAATESLIRCVSAALTVTDISAAVSFYQKVFGFAKRAIMNCPDGKPVHAELTLRGTTLMLGPESPAMGRRTAKSVGASPASLYMYVENVDKVDNVNKVVEKATKLGATPQGPVMDVFWTIVAARLSILMATTGWSGRTRRKPAAKRK